MLELAGISVVWAPTEKKKTKKKKKKNVVVFYNLREALIFSSTQTVCALLTVQGQYRREKMLRPVIYILQNLKPLQSTS